MSIPQDENGRCLDWRRRWDDWKRRIEDCERYPERTIKLPADFDSLFDDFDCWYCGGRESSWQVSAVLESKKILHLRECLEEIMSQAKR